MKREKPDFASVLREKMKQRLKAMGEDEDEDADEDEWKD